MDSAVLLASVAIAAIIAVVLLHYVLRRASSIGLLDIPNDRSSHDVPVPRGAGLGIVVGVAVSTTILFFAGQVSLTILAPTMGAALLIGGIGLVDDRYDVSALVRLAMHFCAAGWALFWLFGTPIGDSDSFSAIGVLLVCAAAFGSVWALNLFNFMDGIDGIALQEAIFISLSGSALLWNSGSSWTLVLICLAAACAVVLRWNWAPAKIFLGDAGSGFIGFLLAIVALGTIEDVRLSTWTILWGVFLVDSGVTLVTRIITGQKWYSAHRSHAYQKLSRRYKSHARVSAGVCVVNVVWLLPWAVLAQASLLPILVCVVAALLPLLVVAIRVGAGQTDEIRGPGVGVA